MPIEPVKQLCTPSAVVTSDSLVEQVAQIEDFAAKRVDGREFFQRNYFTDGLERLVKRGFDRLAGRSEDGAFYLTQAMGGGKTHSLIAFGLLAADPGLRREVIPWISAGNDFGAAKVVIFNGHQNPDNLLWGHLAERLERGEVMAPFWRNGAKTPGVDEWTNVLGSDPVLLNPDTRSDFLNDFPTLAERHNPVVRRVVRRTRPMLEERGLLKRIGVVTHPRPDDGLPSFLFSGEGLEMNLAFKAAYEAAEAFSALYAQRCPGAGFLKTILLRRIGSSARAGLDTARHLLGRLDGPVVSEDEIGEEGVPAENVPPDPKEIQFLKDVERNLDAVISGTDVDPKVQVVLHYLRERQWIEENGTIIFSQYRTTAEWVLEALSAAFPAEPVALYAGGAASFVQRGQERRTAVREQIKRRIQDGEIRLVCATDAACEGLNLQRLGAQVNIDMPWNPSRLVQRKGRVQRIGQVRDYVHVLNLRYAGTVEDEVYAALSHRFGDIFSVLGQLPDSFEDDWIAAVLKDRSALQNFSQRVETAKPPMELRYVRDVADDHGLDWEFTEKVLSSRDIDEWMRQGW
jgi:hypothetical protein